MRAPNHETPPRTQAFLSHIGHEMRAPAATLLASAEALKSGVFGPVTAAQKNALTTIERSVSRWLEIFHDIQTLAGLAPSPQGAEPMICKLDEAAQNACTFVQEYASRLGVTIHRDFPKNLNGTTDPRLFRQMLTALLLSCLESAPEGARSLRLSLAATESNWQARVLLDLPPGAEVSSITASLGQNSHHELAHRLAGLLHIQLTPETTHESLEIIASHELPLQQKATASASEDNCLTASHSAATATKALHIVVAEDQEEILQVLRFYLEGLGHQVRAAPNGQIAWQLCLAEPPHLLLLDMQMPVMSGPELIRRLRAHPSSSLSTLPIITISGLDEASERRASLACGATAHLAKPFHLQELAALLQRLLPS